MVQQSRGERCLVVKDLPFKVQNSAPRSAGSQDTLQEAFMDEKGAPEINQA